MINYTNCVRCEGKGNFFAAGKDFGSCFLCLGTGKRVEKAEDRPLAAAARARAAQKAAQLRGDQPRPQAAPVQASLDFDARRQAAIALWAIHGRSPTRDEVTNYLTMPAPPAEEKKKAPRRTRARKAIIGQPTAA